MSENRLAVGNIFCGRYQIAKFYAAGGMQEVYLCRDLALERDVVLKTPKNGAADRRFRRGAEMGARVNHPNIAATYDYFEDEKITFLIEEYVVGKDLQKRLDEDFHFMDPYLAAHVVHHIALGLGEAHRVGICHRDLKPSNIIVSSDLNLRTIKLTDFGIAKLAESEIAAEMELFDKDSSTLTTSNTLLGAVPYMAPECWANWKGAGQPMDVWALGCIGLQLLSGIPPFGTGRSAIVNVVKAEQAGKVELKEPNWFGVHPPTRPLEKALWNLLLSCLAVDPSERPTAHEVMVACQELCYANSSRHRGVISQVGIPYQNGGVGRNGYISDIESGDQRYFHNSEFYATVLPKVGQMVTFSVYPGRPSPRCAPILLLR